MENYLKLRPTKTIFRDEEVTRLREVAISKLKEKLLPDDKIVKISLIGSSIKKSFGQYAPPGFRGSLYSDFDFIVFVEDDYVIPKWLDREPNGKPFSDNAMNLAYRNKKFVDNKFDIEVFFLRRKSFENKLIQKEGEVAGLPMSENTANKYLSVNIID